MTLSLQYSRQLIRSNPGRIYWSQDILGHMQIDSGMHAACEGATQVRRIQTVTDSAALPSTSIIRTITSSMPKICRNFLDESILHVLITLDDPVLLIIVTTA